MRARIERDHDLPRYVPNNPYPMLHLVIIFDEAARAGLCMLRLGDLVVRAFKRAKPWYFAVGYS